MGSIDDLDAHFNIYSVTLCVQHELPIIILQTMTAAYAYPFKIPLAKLSPLIECHYNPECFPAVQIRRYKPIHVNVFASGKVTITGLKEMERAREIQEGLDWYMQAINSSHTPYIVNHVCCSKICL